jgi:hypothetical protein
VASRFQPLPPLPKRSARPRISPVGATRPCTGDAPTSVLARIPKSGLPNAVAAVVDLPIREVREFVLDIRMEHVERRRVSPRSNASQHRSTISTFSRDTARPVSPSAD